jgi:pimeloyl-ACP methyl ester carboxylesterase
LSIRERKFSVRFSHHLIQGDIINSGKDSVRLVLLHGAGLGTRDRYRYFRTCLTQRSIGSLAFDFIGFGETGGEISESSLQSRTEQACAVIDAMNVGTPLSLLGSSMGAYTAIKLSEIYPIESIILFVPAMYDVAAYAVPFGEEFTRIIRKPNSWAASDAWSIIRTFTGRLLLVIAGQDDVIPKDVVRRIYEAATNASKRELYVVPHSPHLLLHYLSQNHQECENVIELVQHHLTGTDA